MPAVTAQPAEHAVLRGPGQNTEGRVTLRPLPAALLNVVLIGLALLDAWVHFDADEWLGNVCASIAAFALVLRHRLPLPTLLLALPAVLVADALFAALVALYSLASSTRRHVLLSLGALAVVAGGIAPWPSPRRADLWSAAGLTAAGHALAAVTAAALLGRLVQARRDLSARIAEVSEARDHERLLLSRTVLAKERAQLAGEMHDVVSHQVGLITVRAGALQVGSRDPAVKEAAATIRRLSVQTLDELRYMVGVLRASGSRPTELTPQPSLADLQHLVSGSGVEAELHTDVPDDLPPAVQRAVYRTVQEALVNVRKHAPGATATVRIHHEGGTLHATVTNTAPTRSAPPLPNASYGLVGLRERAEFLGGTVNSGPTAEGGYELRLRLPVSGTSRTSLRSAPPGGGRCDRG